MVVAIAVMGVFFLLLRTCMYMCISYVSVKGFVYMIIVFGESLVYLSVCLSVLS